VVAASCCGAGDAAGVIQTVCWIGPSRREACIPPPDLFTCPTFLVQAEREQRRANRTDIRESKRLAELVARQEQQQQQQQQLHVINGTAEAT
jgi:hypothetical protein